jgi:hypothetical protein
MPGTSAAKAKNKVQYVPDAIIAIVEGQPVPPDVSITSSGTVQFVNTDDRNWRVRLFTREHGEHADVDLFLPVRSSATVIAPDKGECKYEILDATNVASNGRRNGGGTIAAGTATASATANTSRAGGGGGGTIKIGP